MDSVTHLAVGAITPLAFRKAPRIGALVLFGIVAGELPDIDFLAGFGPHAMFTLHRGMTHSLAVLPVFALILAVLFKLFLSQLRLRDLTVRVENGAAVINKADDWPLYQIFLAALLAMLLHAYLDCMTTFGTQIFWPFNTMRVALPALFIVDFAFTGVLLLVLLYCLIGFKNEAKRDKQVKWARLGILWAIGYPLLSLAISTGLNYKYNRDYTEVGTTVEKIHITPVLGSPIYWKAIGENEREYRMAWVAAYKPFQEPNFRPAAVYPKVNHEEWELLQERIPVFKDFAGFAGFPTVAETRRDGDYVEYTYKDLRYLYVVPNFILEKYGYANGVFNMQTRQDAESGQIYAWRYLKNGSDKEAMWTAVRPPVSLEKQEAPGERE